jgi:hypothetical protein
MRYASFCVREPAGYDDSNGIAFSGVIGLSLPSGL